MGEGGGGITICMFRSKTTSFSTINCHRVFFFIFCVQWKAHERHLMEEENERILEFAKLQQQREEDRMEKKKQQEQSMAAVQQKVRTITNEFELFQKTTSQKGFTL